ncbi:MAG: cob(I)yrinic acid a,c-diamide adenosyltransferase [Pseudomonadota bacterium]
MGKRLSKIYTRTGDGGDTGLGDGHRISKDEPRIEAMGAIDELNSWLGLIVEELLTDGDELRPLADFLRGCQHHIFDLGGEISIPGFTIIEARHVAKLEEQLDDMNATLAPLENFILPGGSRTIASLHLARSVCRRAERRLVTLGKKEEINLEGLKFLNRLSDLLFVAARHCAQVSETPEVLWQKS